MRKKLPIASLTWIVLVLCICIFAPYLAANDPIQPLFSSLESPSGSLFLGADELGRDFWARLVYGGRATLSASLIAASVSIGGGLLLGLFVSAAGRLLQRALLLLINASLSIPGLLLAMLFVASIGPGYVSVVLAAGLSGIPAFARLIYSHSKTIRERPYIHAAEALGAGRTWIYARHIFPNLAPVFLSYATTFIAWAFTGITTLSFLGLAGDPSIPEWGILLNTGRSYIFTTPRLVLFPGLLISFTILSFHNLGSWFSERKLPGQTSNSGRF